MRDRSPGKGTLTRSVVRRAALVQAVLVLIVFATSASAQLVDPELLRITPLGCNFACYTGPTGPVPITSGGFDLNYISDGQGHGSLVDPVLLILGVAGGGAAPTLTSGSSGLTVTQGGTNTYGGTWNTSTGFAGTFDGTGAKNAYDQIGLNPGGSPSQNYANWTTFAPGVTSWGLYVYTLTFSPDFAVGQTVQLLGNLGLSTYVIAYGCDAVVNGTCSAVKDTFSTPFTYAGLVTQKVPEPSALAFLGTGFVALAWRIRRSSAKSR